MAAESGLRDSLLVAKDDYHEGCPGCALQRRTIAAKGAPKRELTFVAIMVLCNALPISSLFPFIYFMVRDFGIAKVTTHIGTYAGFIGAALMFGRFLSSTHWGVIADRYGRKPVIIFGTASIVVFNTVFGFSTNFWVALISRFLLGFFNGMLGPVRAYASEICSREHQALGLSMVGTMWGLGLIVGPAIGGYLAQPAEKYPSLFPSGSLFEQFPYALPCLCISVFAFVGLILSFWLPESLHNHGGVSNFSEGKPEEISVRKNNGSDASNDNNHAIVVAKEEAEPERKSLWRNWGMISSISVYCIWGLHDMAYSEIFSLWAVSPESYGGLGFTTTEVGNVLAAAGAALLIFQLFIFAPLANRFGAIQMIRLPAVLTLPLVAVYPLMARLDGISLWITLISAAIVKNVLSVCIVTGLFLLINNSVMVKQRGFANGLSMSFMSLFKAVGPACAGVLFSWAQGRIDASFLPGMWSVYVILDVVAAITFVGTFEPILPRSLLDPAQEIGDLKPITSEKFQRSSSFTLQ